MASGDGRESDWEPVGFSFLDYPPFRQLANEAAAVGSFRIDWLETPEAHILKADLPGLKREEIKVQTENGRILSISGDRKVQEKKSDKWHRVERSKGYMMRRFRLPENAKMDEVKAQLENGVLTVLIPKIVPKKPEVRTINITSKL